MSHSFIIRVRTKNRRDERFYKATGDTEHSQRLDRSPIDLNKLDYFFENVKSQSGM